MRATTLVNKNQAMRTPDTVRRDMHTFFAAWDTMQLCGSFDCCAIADHEIQKVARKRWGCNGSIVTFLLFLIGTWYEYHGEHKENYAEATLMKASPQERITYEI